MKIGFVGAGQMATALAAGFCRSGKLSASDIVVHDPSQESVDRFQAHVSGAHIANNNPDVLQSAELVFLAVKPQVIPVIVSELNPPSPDLTFVSVMGGITLDWLIESLGTSNVIRTMPNTPCLIGQGAIGISPADSVDEKVIQYVSELFESVGWPVRLPERLIDAVTGLSGSGPAYVFQFIEALADGGVACGIPRDTAMKLAAQTVAGAANMVLQTGEHPAVLKDRVASPAGTTIAGIQALEENGFRAAAIQAVVAATNRSIELGE